MSNISSQDVYNIFENLYGLIPRNILRDIQKSFDVASQLNRFITKELAINKDNIESSKDEAKIVLYEKRNIYQKFQEKLKNSIAITNVILFYAEYMNIYQIEPQFTHFDKDFSQNVNALLQTREARLKYRLIVDYFQYEQLQVELDNVTFSISLSDKYLFDTSSTDSSMWNLAIFFQPEESFIYIPDELLEVKWNCNQAKDEFLYENQLNDYCNAKMSSDIKGLTQKLLFIAKKYYECENYKCAQSISNIVENILLHNKSHDSRNERLHLLNICNTLIRLKLKLKPNLNKLYESVGFIDNLFGITEESTLLSIETLKFIGMLLIRMGSVDTAFEIFEYLIEKIDSHTPIDVFKYIEVVTLAARFCNDDNKFTTALIYTMRGYDLFLIANVGKVGNNTLPIYEAALEFSRSKGLIKIHKPSYPTYLPNNVWYLLREMTIGFSGVEDRGTVFFLNKWMKYLEKESSNEWMTENYEVATHLSEDLTDHFRSRRSRHRDLLQLYNDDDDNK